MAAPVFTKSFTQDIQQEIKARHCGGLMFTKDALSNTIRVALYDNGAPFSVSGTVTCNVIMADGSTVPVSGSSSGNIAQATLTEACFAVAGPLIVIMKISSGNTTTTVLKAVYTVDVGETGTIVDPGTIIPDVAALIKAIETAVNSIPADYSDLLASIAPDFDSSASYSAGQIVWHGGTLYRFITSHSGTWSYGDAVSITIGGDVADAKSAVGKLARALVGAGFYIAVQPQDVTAAVGDTAQISVAVLAADLYHAEPDPVSVSYQWQYRAVTSSGSWTNSAVTGATNAKISIPVTSVRYNYDWRCAVTGNGVTEYSESARILEPVSNDATEGTE